MEALQSLRHIFRRGRQTAGGPGEPGYAGEVHLGEEMMDESVARPTGPVADKMTRKASRPRKAGDKAR